MDSIIFTKEQKQFNGGVIAFLINTAGAIGHPYPKKKKERNKQIL